VSSRSAAEGTRFAQAYSTQTKSIARQPIWKSKSRHSGSGGFLISIPETLLAIQSDNRCRNDQDETGKVIMKVCIDYSSALAHGSGVSRYVRNLTSALRDNLGPDSLHLFHNMQSLERLPQALTTVGRSELPLSNKLWRLLLLAGAKTQVNRVLRNVKFDVYHGPDCLTPALAQPSVITVHDLTPLSHPQFHTRFSRTYLKLAMPLMAHRASHIIADSKSTKAEITRRLRVNPDNVHVIYPGVDHALFRRVNREGAKQRVQTQLGIHQPYVFALGTLEPRKNLATLIHAFLALPKEIAPLLVLTGSKGWGNFLPPEMRASEELQTRVKFTGFVPDALLPDLYAASEVFVYPSWFEGFGFPIAEAMACGTPVITSDTSSMPEVAGGAALLFAPSDTVQLTNRLHDVLTQPERRARMVEEGFQRCKVFTWRATAAQTINVYNKAMQR
jgi:glycosyltransferase involved in cell wall biosynthesis